MGVMCDFIYTTIFTISHLILILIQYIHYLRASVGTIVSNILSYFNFFSSNFLNTFFIICNTSSIDRRGGPNSFSSSNSFIISTYKSRFFGFR
eukprot:1125620_1